MLTDFDRYPEWNPFLSKVDGRAEEGARLDVVLSQPGGDDISFRAVVIVARRSEELRWKSKFLMKALFAGERFFVMSDAGDGSTRLTHGEDFSGLAVKLVGGSLANVVRGFAAMNQALKKRVENGPAAPEPRANVSLR